MQLTVSSTRFLLEPESEDDRRLLQAMEEAIDGGSIIIISPTGRELRYDYAKFTPNLKVFSGATP